MDAQSVDTTLAIKELVRKPLDNLCVVSFFCLVLRHRALASQLEWCKMVWLLLSEIVSQSNVTIKRLCRRELSK